MAVYKPTRPVSFSAGQEVGNSLFNTKTWFTILFLFFFFFPFFFLLLSRPTPTALLYEPLLWSCFLSLTFLTPQEWIALNFSYNVIPESLTHMKVMRKKGNDHQLKKLLIVERILLVSTWGNFLENSVENMHADVRVWRVRKNVSTELLHNFWGGV